jgi:hypothetical protein
LIKTKKKQILTMLFRYIFTVLLVLGAITHAYGQEEQKIPDEVYSGLEYVLSLSRTTDDKPDPEQLSGLIKFVGSIPEESSMTLNKRRDAAGAFHSFSVQGDFADLIDYAYNPDIPIYVTMPSSLQDQEWLTPQFDDALRNLPKNVKSIEDVHLIRGRERETITPDSHTGGYYVYKQERVVTVLPGPTGPVLISASIQTDRSEVGKKGCVVGDDKNWNYLYSGKTGLNKSGLGWVDSYMYYADSVMIYVADTSANLLRVGSFKWLNAGWAKINMVKSSHILNGIKRFASDFKTVLEAAGLPDARILAGKYRELMQSSEHNLRRMVSPYLQELNDSRVSETCSRVFKKMVSSGEYLQQMSHEELVRVLLLEYIKSYIGKEPYVRVASKSLQTLTSTDLPNQ